MERRRGGKSLLEFRRYAQEDDGECDEDCEYAHPVEALGDETADDWRAGRGEPVDGAHDCHDFGEPASSVDVGRDGSCQEVSSGGADALKEPAHEEKVDGGREYADCGGGDEE